METGETFDRQERVTMVQIERKEPQRAARGLAARGMLSPLLNIN